MPERTRSALESLLEAQDELRVYPESIITGDYDFFAAADEDWTLAHVRQLFSWEIDAERAARAWASFEPQTVQH